MKNSSHNYALVTIFTASFLILTVQIILSSFLRTYLKLPFLSITFAFLGLSSAGVFAFLKYRNQSDEEILQKLPLLITIFGLLLAFYFCIAFQYSVREQFNAISFLSAKAGLAQSAIIKNYFRMIFGLSLVHGLYFSGLFFCLGLVFSLIYKVLSSSVSKLYYFDLMGATLGCILGSICLNVIEFSSIPIFLAFIAFALALFLRATFNHSRISKLATLTLAVFSLCLVLINNQTRILRAYNSLELWSGWNAYSRVSLVKKPDTKADDPIQYRFSLDNGIGNADLAPFSREDPFSLKLFEKFTASSMGFMLGQPSDMLILFAGAGTDMIQSYSYSHGKANIKGVELNPLIVTQALKYDDYHLKEFFDKDNVEMIVREGRSYLETTDQRFDTIIYSWAGSPINNYLGINASTAQYLYTREAFTKLIEILKDNGTIGIVNGNKIRILGSFKKAFEKFGVLDISRHVVIFSPDSDIYSGRLYHEMLSPFDHASLLIKKSPFTRDEIKQIEVHLKKMSRSIVYAPYVNNAEVGKRLRFIPDLLKDIVTSSHVDVLMHKFSKRQRANFVPTSDDKPFHDNFFYIQSLFYPGFLEFYKEHASKLQFRHYTLHLYNLGFTLILILVGVILSAWLIFTNKKVNNFRRDIPFLWYFSCLGVSFMFVEISMLHQFVLYLGNPIYSFSVIVAGLLFSLGLGSLHSDRIFLWCKLNIKKMSFIGAALLVMAYYYLPWMIKTTLGFQLPVKIILAFLIIIPTGFSLGMLFPQGLKIVGRQNNDLVPLAWGLNGYMSVVGSALSVYLSSLFGFNCLILIGAILYLSNTLLPLKFE